MRRRFLPLPLLLLPLVSLLAACQPVAEPARVRSVNVAGEGRVAVAPEIATVRLVAEARDRELGVAQSAAGEVVSAVLALTETLGIPGGQVQSTQVNVQPEYDWHEGRQEFRGYLVQREVRVELEDLSRLGPLVERAMRAGVNRVAPPELGVKDPRRLHREALQQAAADARANAEALAGTLEARLGNVLHVNEVSSGGGPVPKMEMQAMRADSAGSEQNYESGRITFTAQVQAEFELR